MHASETGTFYYHACANPIGGQIHDPMKHVLSAQGSSALAQAGGHATGTAGPHRIHDVVTFETAYSEIHGSSTVTERGSSYVTHVISVLENLDVLQGRIKAKKIVAKLTVRHPHSGGPPSVSFSGTRFEGLEVDNELLHPVLDLQSYARTEDHAGATGAPEYDGVPEFRAEARAHHGRLMANPAAPSWVERRYRSLKEEESSDAGFVCSLVKSVQVKEPRTSSGHIIHVPDVGNLFLGELCVRHRMFRVTMLRLELGCAVRGDMSCCSADSNGSKMPGNGGL